jgi:predicted nuclease with TOPRIM domain
MKMAIEEKQAKLEESTADEVGQVMAVKDKLIHEQEKRNKNLEELTKKLDEINQLLKARIRELENENENLKITQSIRPTKVHQLERVRQAVNRERNILKCACSSINSKPQI